MNFTPARISVIIPTLNEAENIAAALASVQDGSDVEVIVVDGGSSDDTVELARSGRAKVITAVRGRAQQMNAGAAVASGEVLLFLHADTRLPAGYGDHVRQALSQPQVIAGAFELRIDDPRPGLRMVERLANWRSRVGQMPYGDQAIFLWKARFEEAGGFPDLPIMEDFELMRRLRRQGRILTASAAVFTSARRWKKLGAWKTTLINQAVIAAYDLGVAPARLARWYGKSTR